MCCDSNALVICGDNVCYFLDPENLTVIKKLNLWDIWQSVFTCGSYESLSPIGVASDKCLVKFENDTLWAVWFKRSTVNQYSIISRRTVVTG